MKEEILLKNDWFDVISKTDGNGANMMGLRPHGINVVVLPYTIDADGLIENIGVNFEVNPLWGDGQHMTAVTGGVEDKDPDILTAAIRELLEETGINANDIDRWIYLGLVKCSKLIAMDQPCFAVDVTGLPVGEILGDGTINEKLAKFELVPVKEALFKGHDMYIPTVFVRLFREVLEKSFK